MDTDLNESQLKASRRKFWRVPEEMQYIFGLVLLLQKQKKVVREKQRVVHMARSYSYSPSPSRGYRSRYGSPSNRKRLGERGRDPATSLLVRNLRRDTRTEDLRGPFGEFGPLKDVYLPRDYYTGDQRGFGFVQFVYPENAVEAKYEMDGQVINGRKITVVFAEDNRKKPSEMRARDRIRFSRRSPPRRGRSYSRSSCSPHSARAYSRSPDYYSTSPRRHHCSRSISPQGRKYRERSYSRSSCGSRSRSQSPMYRERSYSRSSYGSRSRSRSRSPIWD